MNSVLERIGLYEFFGSFLSGVIVMAISYFLDLPLTDFYIDIDNDFFVSILFMIESYFLGSILQETGSLLDEKILKFSQKARSNFLNDNNKIVKNKLELESFRDIANGILNKTTPVNTYSEEENRYVFFQCKTYLEVNGKSDKITRIESLYVMSRSLFVLFSFCLLIFLACDIKLFDCQTCCQALMFVIVLGLLMFLFFRKAKKFSEYKVREVLRRYKTLK